MEERMVFILGKELIFINSMQLFSCSFEALAKNLSKDKFESLSQEFPEKQLELLKQKEVYPRDQLNNFKKIDEKKFPEKNNFTALKK